MSIIYKTTNLINGKFYVGQHFTSADDGYLGSGKAIILSIKKYGKENFFRETLEVCTSDSVNQKEDYWIEKLSATDRKIGYNISKFSRNPMKGRKHSKETKEKLRNLFKNKPKSEDHKRKLSENHANVCGENNPMFRKKRSEKSKKNQSLKMKGLKWKKEDKDKLKEIRISKNLNLKHSLSMLKYIWTFISPNGKIFENIIDCKEFCKQHKLGYSGIIKSVNLYKTNKYKNWKLFNQIKE